ncbi:hypothetical protein [Lentzea sp. NPDC051838]|uniref:hypothetical protein n=1 Tax=Lentzea sp. NPDC051838 TaxID=3154849 RepID=UPI00341F2DBB
MRFIHKMAAAVGCSALLASWFAIGPASAVEETKCATPMYTSTSVQLAEPGRWAYTYKVSWCVQDGQITTITPHVTHEADGDPCTWVTSAEEAHIPVQDGSGAWRAFNMGEFSCTDGIANPWAYITVWPDGASSVLRKGIGDVIVE